MCSGLAGVTTPTVLRAEGMTRRGIRAAVDRGDYIVLRRGVYAAAGTCEPVRIAAAHGRTLACVSAARHLGLWVLAQPDAVHVEIGRGGHAYRHSDCGCVGHWDAEAFGPERFGIPQVTTVLCQILRCHGLEDFFVALESALRLGMLRRQDLDVLRSMCPTSAAEAIDIARDDADSGLESVLRWRLRHLGLRIRTQVSVVSVGRVDALIGDRLIVEVDGAGNHDAPSQRHRDLVRDANAAAWGYVTLRFDYGLVVHDWETVFAAIMGALDHGHHLTR